MVVFMNGDFMQMEKARISPEDRGFLFADGVYEVIRSYNGRLFQIDAHLRRLERSLKALRIGFSEVERLREVSRQLIEENGLSSAQAIVYVQITRGAAPRLHRFPTEDVPATVYACAYMLQPHDDDMQNGTKIITVPDVRWSRCDIKSIALLPNVLACQQASEKGATEAVFIRNGAVTEGTRSNVFGVFHDQVMTAPRSNYILTGVTRELVLGLCRKLNIPVREFPIFEGQLQDAEELFIAGTVVEITPVVKVNDMQVRDGIPGPVTRKLQNALRELVARVS